MKVRVFKGRNKGKVGVVKNERYDAYYVTFGHTVMVNEGFGSMAEYEDGYWVKKEFTVVTYDD